ncbi:hypothetical protein A2U01_0108396, partial [Trifolium medium]|nr:hypothetical protein [Trifolium medium]
MPAFTGSSLARCGSRKGTQIPCISTRSLLVGGGGMLFLPF